MIRPRTLLISAFAALASCTPPVGLVDGTPSPELTACAREGGTLQSRGRRGTVMCVHPYGDAGKSCASNKDCQGRCLAARDDGAMPEAGATSPGRCQPDDKLFGCFAELEGGKVVKPMCID